MRFIPSRPNRRGSVLLLFGVVYIIIGITTALLPLPPTSLSGYAVADNILPLQVWGFIWAGVGLFGAAAAWLPTRRDDLGYYALAGFGLLWGSMAAASTVVYGAQRGWVIALTYGAFAMALLIVSGMDRDE
jgi:hypothetical protein